MNIIQKGNPNYTKQIKRFVCKCGCVFEAEKGEYTVGSQHNEENIMLANALLARAWCILIRR